MNWRKVNLGELVENFSVKAKNENGSDGLEFFGVSNENGITISKYAAEDKADEYKIIEKGCFVYNPYRINVGSIALLNEDKKGLISPAYVVFKVKPNSIKEELLLKFLKSKEGLRQIKMYGRGTVRQALRFEDLCKIELSIPDYIEQERLWGKLNQIDFKGNKVANEIIHQLDLIKQLRQAFLCDAMKGKLTENWRKGNPDIEPASVLLKQIMNEKERLIKEGKLKKDKPLPPIKPEEIPFEIPESWVWCKLGEIISFGPSNGFSPQESKKGTGIKCLTLTATTSGVFKEQYFKLVDEQISKDSYLWLESGDILIQRGNSFDYVGIAAIYEGEPHTFIYPDLMIKIRVPELIDANYIHKVLVVPFNRKYFSNKAFGAQKSMPKINQGVVLNTLIPLPSLKEQKQIVGKINQLMKICDEMEQSVTQSKEQSEQLLQVALKEALEPEKHLIDAE